jgi:hypothetical protein
MTSPENTDSQSGTGADDTDESLSRAGEEAAPATLVEPLLPMQANQVLDGFLADLQVRVDDRPLIMRLSPIRTEAGARRSSCEPNLRVLAS